jgi:hypothetical protein
LGHIGNVDQTPAYFNIMSNVNVEEHDVKTVLIRGMGNDKTRIAIILFLSVPSQKGIVVFYRERD